MPRGRFWHPHGAGGSLAPPIAFFLHRRTGAWTPVNYISSAVTPSQLCRCCHQLHPTFHYQEGRFNRTGGRVSQQM